MKTRKPKPTEQAGIALQQYSGMRKAIEVLEKQLEATPFAVHTKALLVDDGDEHCTIITYSDGSRLQFSRNGVWQASTVILEEGE